MDSNPSALFMMCKATNEGRPIRVALNLRVAK